MRHFGAISRGVLRRKPWSAVALALHFAAYDFI
jgi:hypothetical protein